MNNFNDMIKIVMIISIFLISVCIFTNTISAATVNVNPNDSDGIKGAVEKSNNGDTILLARGTYKGVTNKNIYLEKNVIIRGNGPTSSVIIDAQKTDRIFYYTYGSKEVTFTNITFLNCNIAVYAMSLT